VQKQLGPILVALAVLALVLAGWVYWQRLSSEAPPVTSHPSAGSSEPGVGLPTPVPFRGGRLRTGGEQAGAPSRPPAAPSH